MLWTLQNLLYHSEMRGLFFVFVFFLFSFNQAMNLVGLCCKFCVFDGSFYLRLVFVPLIGICPAYVCSGISRIFEQTLFTEFGAFYFPRFPSYFLAAVVALNSALWFFSPERVWIFFWHFICPVQCQLWLALRLTVIKNRWPFPFFQESVLS